MINNLLDERIPGALLLEPREVYDRAVLGVTLDGRAIYDSEHVIRCTMQADGMSLEDAVEWHEFNTFCAYMGPKTPLFTRVDFDVLVDEVGEE